MDTIESQISKLDTRISHLDNRVGNLDTRVSNLERDVAAVKVDVAVIRANCAYFMTTEDLQREMNGLTWKLFGYASLLVGAAYYIARNVH